MDRFEEVDALDTDALRRLLTEGAERERVWAAWALSLRLGTQAWPELVWASRSEPDPGARRHLVVLLAGYRDMELLAVMARHDPDGYVRASACQYLAVLAPDSPAVRVLLRERLEDAFPAVRVAIVQYLRVPDGEDLGWVARAAADADPEVRSAAVDALSRLGARAVPVLRERFRGEPDSGLRRSLLRGWLEAADALALLEDCALLPVDRAGEVLDLLASLKLTFEWERLAPIAARGEPVLDLSVLACLRQEGAPAEARMWWEDLVLRGYRTTRPRGAYEVGFRALCLLLKALPPLRWEALSAAERERLDRVRAVLEDVCAEDETSDEDEEDLYEDDEGWGPGPESELLELLRQRAR